MRLTLRTLLAYLDDVLDPADKEELARKIESSDFARDLVHQTRDSVRRLRLSAPQVIGAGIGMDPNTVAEYLDNALPPEQVGDYERICLESDVHLAETAACHHVLTMVLGEPAEVEPRARQRMYMIPSEARERRRLRAESAHSRGPLASTVAVAAPPMAAASAMAMRSVGPATNAVEIPDYLRTRPWWPRAVLALAAVLLVGTALFLVGDMMGLFEAGPDMTAVAHDTGPPQKGLDTQPKAEVVAGNASAATMPAAKEATASPPLEPTSPQPVATASSPSQSVGTTETTPTPATTVVEIPATDNVAATESTPPVDPSVDAAPRVIASPGTPLPPGTTSVPSDDPAADGTTSIAPLGVAADPAVAPSEVGIEGANDAAVLPGPAELGTYLGGKTVLLRLDATKGGWFRVEPRSAIVAGERLLSLPEFRPQITLASGVMLDMSGGTQVVMSAGEAAGSLAANAASGATPMIEVLYGRIILTNTSSADSQVWIKAGAHEGKVVLERNATLAVEVERPYVPGNDPRTTPAPVVVRMFASVGKVTWTDGSGEVAVEKPSRWTLTSNGPAEVTADESPPEWIDREPVVHRSEQLYGAPKIEETVMSDRPVDIQLLELFKGRDRREVKSLVTRSSIHIGLYSPFIEALRDPDQKVPTWRTHIETLRSAMAQSPESAEAVFKALADERGGAASDLYEMLCGYNAKQVGTTPEEMKSGALADLIERLDEGLDYRVLAVHNLWEITDKQLMPNPAASETVRKQNIRRWRDRLESGDLQPVKREADEEGENGRGGN